jgi:hypothetical protein
MVPQTPTPVLEVELVGHLALARLQPALDDAVGQLAPGTMESFALLVDCTRMDGYDRDARDHFVAWNAKLRTRCLRLAVVTQRQLWHMVVAGMALAARQQMKAFHDRTTALLWLRGA